MRYQQLDALRGIAALMVVFSHFSLIDPLSGITHTPLRVLANGHAAVILFFVLSGFVLTLQLTSELRPTFMNFLIKRVCRIYLPHLASLIIAFFTFLALYKSAQGWAGVWANGLWQRGIGPSQLMSHIYFLLPFRNNTLNPVLWSLVYEMRISVIFPAAVFAICRIPVWCSLAIAFAMSTIACYWETHFGHALMPASIEGEWIPMLHYSSMFVVGALIAKHRNAIVTVVSGMSHLHVVTAATVTLGVYLSIRTLEQRLAFTPVVQSFMLDWSILLVVGLLVVATIAIRPFAKILSIPPLEFLGKISYSVYLVHGIVLLAMIHSVGATHPRLSLALAAALVLPVSTLAYYAIERPSMDLGRYLAKVNTDVEPSLTTLSADSPGLRR